VSGVGGGITKAGSGILTLTNINTFTGLTTVSAGTLTLGHATDTLSGAITISGGTLNVDNPDSVGAVTLTSGTISGDSVLTGTSYSVASGTISTGLGGSGDLTKTTAGTITLSGLSTTAANNYLGTTILGGGTTTLTQDAAFTGGLTFGATVADTNVSTLNLNNASATFAGAMLVQTNTASPTNNIITIGSGKKLTNNGNVNFGTAVDNSRNGLTVSGAGGWDVTSSNGTFGGIGTVSGSGGAPTMAIDMSGLAEFNANLRTGGAGADGGTFRVGYVGAGTNTRNNTVSLATNSTISADVVELRTSSVGTSTLLLGNGTQIINSDTIRMSLGSSRAESSSLSFRTADGTLKIRGTDGGNTTRSSFSMLGSSTSGNVTSTFDVTAHDVDLLFNTVSIYNHTANTTASTTYNATFSFDRGILDATTFNIGTKSSGTFNNVGNAVANIGSSANLTNSATLGAVNLGVLSSTGTVGVGAALNPQLNISGTATTVNFNTLSLANYAGTTGATLTSTVNISGGTTAGTGGIDMATAANGTVNSTLTVSGGSLSVGTSGVSATNGIFRTTASVNATTTLRLNGGSLNLNGNNIGAAGGNAITTQFESGTLRNVGQINGGTTGLTKTTSGTLTLTGTNTYTGSTTINEGTLIASGGLAIADTGAVVLANVAGATFDVAASETIGSLAGGGTTGGNVSLGANTLTTGDATNTNFAGVISGAGGALTKQGLGILTLSGTNSYTGGTTVTSGSLQVGVSGTGTTGTGAVTVQSGGTILGTGSVRGSSFTAESGSIIHAGDGTLQSNYGTLNFTPVSGSGAIDFQSGSSVILGINPGGTSDLLNFVGTGSSSLLFNGNLTVGPSTFTPLATEIFNLLDWSLLGSTPTFASRYSAGSYGGLLLGNGDDNLGFDLPDIFGSGFAWDISSFTTNGSIAIVVIPEPSRAFLLLLGLTGLFTRRRR
jgi:autotransporter-associated beta strand protein